MRLCIEQQPPPHVKQTCVWCQKQCISGHRRRDPFGSTYCDVCGHQVQYKIRKAFKQTPELAFYAASIPGFLRYCKPSLIGLGYIYDGDSFQYQPPPVEFPKHKPRPRQFPVECFRCGKKIPIKASSSRRGINVNVVYCAACGLATRRAAARIQQSDARLREMYKLVPSVRLFLRPDILSWLTSSVDPMSFFDIRDSEHSETSHSPPCF